MFVYLHGLEYETYRLNRQFLVGNEDLFLDVNFDNTINIINIGLVQNKSIISSVGRHAPQS